jgi:hypothetical protein
MTNQGKKFAHPVACKPPPGFLRIVVGKTPWNLSRLGNSEEEAEGVPKDLTDEIESFKRNSRCGEVATT